MSSQQVVPVPVDILKQIADMLRKAWIPKIQRGKEYFVTEGWQVVTFPEPFRDMPTVGGLLLARPGWYVEELFEPPTLDLSDVKKTLEDYIKKIEELPDLNLAIPRLPHPELEVLIADRLQETANRLLGDWGVFNWMRDALTRVFRAIGAELGRIIEYDVWDSNVKLQVDKIQTEIENKVNPILDTITAGVNSAISKIKNGLLESTNKAVTRIEEVTNKITTYATDALNRSIDKFWETTGLEKGVIPSELQLRNVTQTSFEVRSPGPSTLHWWAIGEYYVPGLPIAERIETIIKEVAG